MSLMLSRFRCNKCNKEFEGPLVSGSIPKLFCPGCRSYDTEWLTQKNMDFVARFLGDNPTWGIVSSCPRCGSPIYGAKEIPAGLTDPPVRYTCPCRLRKDFSETVEVK